MSNRLFQSRLFGLNREAKLITCLYQANAAAAPILLKSIGIKSIAHTATGVITIVLQDGYFKLLGFKVSVGFSGLTATQVQFGGINVTGTLLNGIPAKTVVVNYYTTTTGAAVDIAANVNNIISVELLVQNEK